MTRYWSSMKIQTSSSHFRPHKINQARNINRIIINTVDLIESIDKQTNVHNDEANKRFEF